MHPDPDIHGIDPRLRAELRRLVRRIRARDLHRRSAGAWLVCAVVSLALAAGAHALDLAAIVAVAAPGAVFLFSAWMISRWWQYPITNYAAAAALVEQAHPRLHQALRTALEQRRDARGRYSFLQQRVIADALEHAHRHRWSDTRLPASGRATFTHGAALIAACAVIAGSLHYVPSARPGGTSARPATVAGGLEITPGDTEVERGTTVVFTARFGGDVPPAATLQWRSADGAQLSRPMERSLADPVFAATVPHLESDIEYRVAFRDSSSQSHRITVYDLPRMVRGDAALDYPAFTGLAPRTIEDTRRISAVEGTRLDYTILTNKPVREAVLRATDGSTLALTPANPEGTRFVASLVLERSERYSLQLRDEAGRTSPAPTEIRIEALPNRRPALRVAFPRGDPRVSALEEVAIEATASDDFGLLDYGIGWSLGGATPTFVSLRPLPASGADTPAAREAAFSHLIRLEAHGVEPDQLVTWFAWADDMGSDGAPRRTTGELRFAEVRPFDEAFREGEGAGQAGQQSGAGEEAADLLEMQRDISLAIWRLRDRTTGSDEFHADVSTVHDAQQAALAQLSAVTGRIQDPDLRAAARDAGEHMTRAARQLDEAREQSATAPLDPAWAASQSAYQALLRLQPRTSQVNRDRQSGSSGRSRANQRQLDQLRFKDEQDRYETETQAQPSTTPEQREQMQTLARLRELARRQADMNERLQQLQTALEAAPDEATREEIRRELKRLEEEQRRMLADVDELRQRMDQVPREASSPGTREQVERTREEMRRAGEALQEGEVSRALASGTRARETLDQAREEMRRQSASGFAEDMRELRREARELAEAQQRTSREMSDTRRTAAPSLDTSAQREELVRAIEENRAALDALTTQLRRVTEESEESEPGLHRQLYDLLRDQGQGGGPDDRMQAAAELLRRGFIDQALEQQPAIGESIERLARGVERAAESVLGDEATTLRYAQTELDQLAREVAPAADAESGGSDPPDSRNRPASASREPGASPSSGDRADDELTRALAAFAPGQGEGRGDGAASPLTEGDFGAWEERLLTVEALLDQPEARERLAGARELAAALRRDYRRHASPPDRATIESGVVAPLTEVRGWLRQELARREDPATLQPIDRDPVPEAFAESVRRYYEALGDP